MYQNSIDVQWVGIRKDSSGKGAVVGWFVEKGKRTSPLELWERQDSPVPYAYLFRGKIGKKMNVEKHHITTTFLSDIESLKKNYRTESNFEKIIKNWGAVCNDELSMYVTMIKLGV